MGPVAGAAIGQGINLIGGFIGDAINANRARKAWRANNEYNSPYNQMLRLKAAGLNPNLVYGNGSVQNTSSQAYDTPKADLSKVGSEGLQNYTALRQIKMQNDLLEKQMEFINIQIADKVSSIKFRDIAQTNKTITDTNFTNLSAEQKKQIMSQFLQNTSLDQELKRKQIDSTSAHTDMVKMQLESYPKEIKAKLLEAYQRINNLKLSASNIQADTQIKAMEGMLKQLHVLMRQKGIEPNDSLLFRQMLDKLPEKARKNHNEFMKTNKYHIRR